MSKITFPITLDLTSFMLDYQNRKEFLGWAMSDQEFLESFATLLATGVSPEQSHPVSLHIIQTKILEIIGNDQSLALELIKQNAESEAEVRELRRKLGQKDLAMRSCLDYVSETWVDTTLETLLKSGLEA